MQDRVQDISTLLQRVEQSGHDKIRLAICDIDGVLRGKIVSIEKFRAIAEKGFGFCDVVFGWDIQDKAYDNATVTGWHSGYPDAVATPDVCTYREVPWMDNLPFVLADFSKAEESLAAVCPRSLLRQTLHHANELGFKPMFAQEFEWFNFKKGPNGSGLPTPITEGMFGYSLLRAAMQNDYMEALFDGLREYGIPLEGLHTETGPGVYEAAITYSDVLEAADRAVLFKAAVKEIAAPFEITPSFMAKWNASLPGCSGHIHQSLQDTNGKNLFYEGDATNGMSQLMEHYIAGQLYCMPYIMPMFAPTINSYKRLVEGTWAPTNVTWGFDNRTTALRVIGGSASGMRLETRVPGSDSNPYLAMAAALAAGLYGIRNKLPLAKEPTTGSGYADSAAERLPVSLQDAVRAMKTSTIAGELFGSAFVDHFCKTREWEWRQFTTAVTDWELQRYFESI